MKCYFAHPKKKKRQIKFIKKILQECGGFEVIDPLEHTKQEDNNYIPEDDFTLLASCDVVFIYLPRTFHRCIGTSIELYYAWTLNKTIYALTYKWNPFLKYAGKVFLSWDNFLEWFIIK